MKKYGKEKIWQEYCGFLDLSLKEYMYIQNRLMQEQILQWSASGLGKKLLNGQTPGTVEEFREAMPLTAYEDYADVLLQKKTDMLPQEPIVWIQTTWEGGLRPVKLAPYTREMLDVYKHNSIAIMILAASKGKMNYSVSSKDSVLYGGAPLPFATGLLPSLLREDLDLAWLPDSDAYADLSFGDRIKKGFELAYKHGIDYFFAIGSVANYITENFSKATSSKHRKISVSPSIAFNYLRAKYVSKRDGRPILPGDVFKMKGFIATGTDAKCYRERLAKAWGVYPIEVAAGTESTCLGVETWEHKGMTFFPDACFYEFIPENEMLRNLQDPDYIPKTCLMDEVAADQNYELVISVLKGGAFARYRIGDVYRCLGTDQKNGVPRFTFLDRIPTVIDIAGFTRITEASIDEVIRLSKLGIGAWLAKKEYTEDNNPYLHMYMEVSPDTLATDAITKKVITEHLTVYFKYFDSDYEDLKKLLNIEPLQITLLRYGTIKKYEKQNNCKLPRINQSALDISGLLQNRKGAAAVLATGRGI
jgi:hypothetical protein